MTHQTTSVPVTLQQNYGALWDIIRRVLFVIHVDRLVVPTVSSCSLVSCARQVRASWADGDPHVSLNNPLDTDVSSQVSVEASQRKCLLARHICVRQCHVDAGSDDVGGLHDTCAVRGWNQRAEVWTVSTGYIQSGASYRRPGSFFGRA